MGKKMLQPAEKEFKTVSGRTLMMLNLNDNAASRVYTVFVVAGKSWTQLFIGTVENWDDDIYLEYRIKQHPLL